MALTRKMLKEMGIADETAEEIIRAHAESIDALKGYKADSERLSEVSAELDEVKKSEGDYRLRFEELEKSYEGFKGEVLRENTDRKKREGLAKIIRSCMIPENCVDPIVKVTDLDTLELSEDGGIANEDAVRSGIAQNWSAFIPKVYTMGAQTANPPAVQSERGFSLEEIRRMTPKEINENYSAIRKSLAGTDRE